MSTYDSSHCSWATMFVTLGVLLILAVSWAHEPYDTSFLKASIVQWAEKKTSQLINDVNEAVTGLQQLVEKASSPEVKKLVSLLEGNQEYLGACEELSDFSLSDGSYCINITGDIANLTELGYDGYNMLSDLGVEIEYLVEELNHCQGLSIFKQIACYKQAFNDIQGAIKEYTIEFSQYLRNVTAVCQEVEVDISKCFSYSESVSSYDFEKAIDLCKH